MKLPTVLAVSILLGGGVGAAWAYWSVGSAAPVSAVIASANVVSPSKPDSSAFPAPKAVADKPAYNFGTMLRGATASHEFVIRNEGNAALTLRAGKTSCKCTLSDVDAEGVPPGESTVVRVEWAAKVLAGDFRQTATIITNDPRKPRIELSIEGKVNEVSGLAPGDFNLGVVAADAGATTAIYVMAFDTEDLQVTAAMADTSKNPERYAVTVEEVDPTVAPKEGALAASKIAVAADAGLPIGPIHEWVRVRTNLAGREDFLVPITGRVRGAVTVHGRGWNRETGVLNLGVLEQPSGGEATLALSCRGPYADEIAFEVASVDPPELVAEVGERRTLRDGVSHTKLRVAVPPGTRSMVRMTRAVDDIDVGEGDAVILLKTTHPQSPEMKLLVRFIVQ